MEQFIMDLAPQFPALSLLFYIAWQASTACGHARDWKPTIHIHLTLEDDNGEPQTD